jgi:hypothetical protein
MLARKATRELLAAGDVPDGLPPALTAGQRNLVERVAYAIPRVGARVPWRSDCLVQALAARHWLAREGVASNLTIGVRNEGGFAAHAWLKVGDEVVTGGPIADFAPLFGPGDARSDQARTRSSLARNQR